MIRSVLILVSGAALGALLAAWLSGSTGPATAPERFAHVPETREVLVDRSLSIEEARVLREDAYAAISTVEDTLALPTEFDRMEALFVLAGRSDAAAVQDLIYQANGIAEPAQRGRAIGILLGRLTDLDPKSALAIARSPALSGMRAFEFEVWETWSRQDLESALDEAMSLSGSQRSRAAQGIFRGFRLPDANTVFDIQMMLGSEPDNTTLSRWLATLYDYAPAESVAFIEGLPPGALQNNAVWVLAYRIAQSGAPTAAAQFSTPELQQLFDYRFAEQLAQIDPERAIDLYFANQQDPRQTSLVQEALRKIAAADPDRALMISGRLDGEARKIAIRAIGEGMLASDPERALNWVRENDDTSNDALLAHLISQVARRDPDLAIAQAALIRSRQQRSEAYLQIASSLASSDPVAALETIDHIPDPGSRQSAISNVLRTVAMKGPDRALDLYDTLPPKDQRGVLESTAAMIAYSDPDKALSLMARAEPEEARRIRQSVISAISGQRGFDDTMIFIERFRDEPDFLELRSRVVTELSYREPERALQYAEQHLSGRDYESVVASSAPQIAESDPRRALDMAGRVPEHGRAQGPCFANKLF